ncbi:MAG TPA: tetratricopeptide repeat protein [Vicinamibacterales bacterium]
MRRTVEGSGSPEQRLDSWKEIAAYLKRHVTTVRRWERCEGLPVHRHVHRKLGSVYAFRPELDDWWRNRIQLESRRQRRADTRVGGAGVAARTAATQILHANRRLIASAAVVLFSIVTTAYLVLPGRTNDAPRQHVTAVSSVNPAAHQEYLIGRYHLWRDNEEHLQRAIAHFERAIEIDPQYAAAYASLAHAWWKRGLWSRTLAVTEAPARAAAQQALQIDDTLPDAYVVLADLERLYGRDLIRAEKLVTRALALNPDHIDAHYTYGLLLMTLGRFDEAITHMETAERLDPLAPAIQSDFGRVLYRARRYEEAIARLNRALELEPGMGWLVYQRLAAAYEQLGQYDQALMALRRASHSGGRSHSAQFARILAHMGNHREAKRLLKDVDDMSSGSALNEIAAAYVALGDYDSAFVLLFDWLGRREPGPNFVAVDPPFDRLHSDPRWSDVVRRVKRNSVKSHVTG